MGRLAYKLVCGNTKYAAIISGGFSVAQFSLEILFFICFAVYVAAPIPTAVKVFYGIAAGLAPIFLLASALFIFGVSTDNSKWMNLWFITHGIVVLSEIILTLVGFIFLSDLRDILQFYASAWNLAQRQVELGLYAGDLSSCTPFPTQVVLSSSGHGVTFVGFFAQQGANGWIAFIAIGLLLKNLFNITMFYVCYVHYQDMERSFARRATYR